MIIIVPFSKPREGHLLASFVAHQKTRPDCVVIVENGAASGRTIEFCSQGRFGGAPVVILKSKPHQSHAKNVGLAYARENGHERAAIFDCDDYYGPDYLTQVAAKLVPGKVVGRSRFFVYDDEGLFLPEHGEPWIFPGGTHAFYPAEVEDYPLLPVAEDTVFLSRCRARGMGAIDLQPWGYCYFRTTLYEHTYTGNVREQAAKIGIPIKDYGGRFEAKIVDGAP